MTLKLSPTKTAILTALLHNPGVPSKQALELARQTKAGAGLQMSVARLSEMRHAGLIEPTKSAPGSKAYCWRLTSAGTLAILGRPAPPPSTAPNAPPAPAAPVMAAVDPIAQAIESVADEITARVLTRLRLNLARELEQLLPVIDTPSQGVDIDAILRRGLAHVPANEPDITPEPSVAHGTIVAPPAKPVAPVTQSAKPRKTKVMIVGLKPSQQDVITKEFGRELDLRFVNAGTQLRNRLSELSSRSDFAVAMTDFVGHQDEDVIKSRGGNLVRVSGGVSSLRDALTRIYCEAAA